jgi:hypothetical protein
MTEWCPRRPAKQADRAFKVDYRGRTVDVPEVWRSSTPAFTSDEISSHENVATGNVGLMNAEDQQAVAAIGNQQIVAAVGGMMVHEVIEVGEHRPALEVDRIGAVDKAGSDTWIYADTDGDRKIDFTIHLDDAMTLKADYFTL